MARQRDAAKERFWRTMVRQWRHSGLAVGDFCEQRQLSEASFYAWRRTLVARDRAKRNNADQASGAGPANPPLFVPVSVAVPATTALEVVLAGGCVVRVPAGFDADSLRQVLAVLQEDAPC
jgi:hypothetical protein